MTRPAIVIVTLAAALGCGECTCFAGHAELRHEENGRTVVVTAQGFRDFGVGAIGAPHAFGILYPEFRGSGYRVHMAVDDRPVVDVARVPSEHAPSSNTLEEMLAEIEVRVSEAGDHVALHFDGRWLVFHLLGAGTPFDLPRSASEGDELDLAAMPSAEALALAFLADEEASYDAHELFWSALDEIGGGAPWDEAVVGPWPRSERAHGWLMHRLEEGGEPFEGTARAALDAEARRVVEESEIEVQRRRASEALVALGGESIAWLDARAVSTWADVPADASARSEARIYLAGRTRYSTYVPVGTEPPVDSATEALVTAARGVAESKRPSQNAELRFVRRAGVEIVGATSTQELVASNFDLDLALHLLETRGTDADRAWANDLVLAEWPALDWTALDDALVRRITAHPDDETLRRAVEERAARAFRDLPDVRSVATVLFAFARPETDDQALRGLLAHLDQQHWFVLEDHLDRASPAFERDAVTEARRIIDAAGALDDADEPTRYRVAHAVDLVFAIEEDGAECAELEALLEIRRRTRTYTSPSLPARCAPAAPTMAP
jgi:hypothetical protein